MCSAASSAGRSRCCFLSNLRLTSLRLCPKGLIDYNFHCLKNAIQEVFDVRGSRKLGAQRRCSKHAVTNGHLTPPLRSNAAQLSWFMNYFWPRDSAWALVWRRPELQEFSLKSTISSNRVTSAVMKFERFLKDLKRKWFESLSRHVGSFEHFQLLGVDCFCLCMLSPSRSLLVSVFVRSVTDSAFVLFSSFQMFSPVTDYFFKFILIIFFYWTSRHWASV